MKYKCCEKFNTELKDDNLLTVLKDKVFIMSDGGHGGCVEISHCPFCGKGLIDEKTRERSERIKKQLEPEFLKIGNGDLRVRCDSDGGFTNIILRDADDGDVIIVGEDDLSTLSRYFIHVLESK